MANLSYARKQITKRRCAAISEPRTEGVRQAWKTEHSALNARSHSYIHRAAKSEYRLPFHHTCGLYESEGHVVSKNITYSNQIQSSLRTGSSNVLDLLAMANPLAFVICTILFEVASLKQSRFIQSPLPQYRTQGGSLLRLI
jgi:hypothetical protein